MTELRPKDLVLYFLYVLGGWQRRVHTEDVALKCYEVAPSMFSWTKYPQYPDPTPARYALETAKKSDSGSLVTGSSERKRSGRSIGGWRLTEKGIQWVKSNKDRIEAALGTHVMVGNRLPSGRRIKELLRSPAFKKFQSAGQEADISFAEFSESLLCTVNAGVEVLQDRIEELLSVAEELRTPEIREYAKFCEKKFLGKSNGSRR
jgi:hypothetical protein